MRVLMSSHNHPRIAYLYCVFSSLKLDGFTKTLVMSITTDTLNAILHCAIEKMYEEKYVSLRLEYMRRNNIMTLYTSLSL